MTDRFLLTPGCKGTPAFNEDAWATGVPKIPDEHVELVPQGAQLDEGIGTALAQWALGAPAALGDDVVQAFAGIQVTPAQIALYLGRAPTSHDTKALKDWYRALKSGKVKAPQAPPSNAFIDPDDDPSAGGEIVFTFDQVKRNIESAATTDILDIARDQISGVQDEAEQAQLRALADEREGILREIPA